MKLLYIYYSPTSRLSIQILALLCFPEWGPYQGTQVGQRCAILQSIVPTQTWGLAPDPLCSLLKEDTTNTFQNLSWPPMRFFFLAEFSSFLVSSSKNLR